MKSIGGKRTFNFHEAVFLAGCEEDAAVVRGFSVPQHGFRTQRAPVCVVLCGFVYRLFCGLLCGFVYRFLYNLLYMLLCRLLDGVLPFRSSHVEPLILPAR